MGYILTLQIFKLWNYNYKSAYNLGGVSEVFYKKKKFYFQIVGKLGDAFLF
jgi:hypothetical protein